MITRLTFSTLLAVLHLTVYAHYSATPARSSMIQRGSIFSTLSHSEIVEVTLVTDLEKLETGLKSEEYQPAEFSFVDKNGKTITSDVEIRPRGRFRRRVCSFPPLKMKFSKKQLVKSGFGPYRSMKLVTHCLDDNYAGKENVFREYLVYKMYNLVSEHSYRVQLVQVNYIDSQNPKNKMRRYAFVIEGTKEMANRLGGEECEECMNPDTDMVSTKNENLMAIFQYMIGNEDWSLKLLRNLKLVQPVNGGPMIPVPYDFDFAGLVNAPYALPNTDLNLKSVRERALMGWPVDPRQMKVHISFFKLKRPQLEELIANFKPLSKLDRNDMLDYIDGFYKDLDKITEQNMAAVKSLEGSPSKQ